MLGRRPFDPARTAVYRVVEDIPEAGYVKGNLLVIVLTDGPGEHRIGEEIADVIRWLGRGWVEEVPLPLAPAL
jgi:hypothetical protein